ncbi:hypothetical protein ACIHFD_63025 [Nonomuraea sp. NPDC051941]|uniref:hypothetical protein n=1 Tax=Nonomuraea sp. NPDC051941 TaxID=3364373 RepID=UPI0037C783BC
MLRRAIDAGVVRPELLPRDLTVITVMSLATVHPGDPQGEDRRRYLALLIDGLRPSPVTLPHPHRMTSSSHPAPTNRRPDHSMLSLHQAALRQGRRPVHRGRPARRPGGHGRQKPQVKGLIARFRQVADLVREERHQPDPAPASRGTETRLRTASAPWQDPFVCTAPTTGRTRASPTSG